MRRRVGVILLVGVTLLAGTVTAVAIAAGGGRVLELRLRTADLILRVNGYGEQQSSSPSQVGITLAADVLFRFNSAKLNARAQSILGGVAAQIHQQARGPVYIDGYTDSRGTPTYNIGLSVRRADAVERALASTGARFIVRGHGEANPVAPNTNPDGSDNPAGRAKNRRVTVTFAKG